MSAAHSLPPLPDVASTLRDDRKLSERLGRIDALADAVRVLNAMIEADPSNDGLREARRRIERLPGGFLEERPEKPRKPKPEPKPPPRSAPRFREVITYRGATKTLVDWAFVAGIPAATIRNRLFLRWSVAKALETPHKGCGGIGASR